MATSTTNFIDTNKNSSLGGVIAVTIAGGGANIQCGVSGTTDSTGTITFSTFPVRSCLVQQYSGTQVYMNINVVATAAATAWKISSITPHPIPVDDLSKLNFIGTAGDIVQILWRN
jgi:hypothetical protein